MPRRALAVVPLAVSVLFAHAVLAQGTSPQDHAPSGTMIGLSIGVPGYESRAASEFLVVGLNILQAKPSKPGIEFSLGTIPRLLSNQAVVLGGRLDASAAHPRVDARTDSLIRRLGVSGACRLLPQWPDRHLRGNPCFDGGLLTLTTSADGAASGHIVGELSFMYLHGQRIPRGRLGDILGPAQQRAVLPRT